MGNLYDTDIVAWAWEQAALLRSGQLSAIDALNIAEEIEDVAKSEQHELGNRLVILLAHLLKWQFQPDRRGHSWLRTIKNQRKAIARHMRRMPSLKHFVTDEEWLGDLWDEAISVAAKEMGRSVPPLQRWPLFEVLDPDFFPD